MSQKNDWSCPLTGDMDAYQYFLTLPTYIQESIHQSGVHFHSEKELRNLVRNLHQEG